MNRKQLLILLILVVVLGGIGLLLRRNQEASGTTDTSMGKKLLGELPINDVAQISVKEGTNELALAKKDGVWAVRERDNYPANYSQISEFLIKAKDVKIVQTEPGAPSQMPRYGLAVGQGTNQPVVIDLKDQAGKPVKSFTLGKKHMRKSDRPSPFGDMGEEGFPDGRYVKTDNSSFVALISEPFSNLEPKADQWLNKDFLKIEKARTITATFSEATNSWKLTRETEAGEWKLADAKPNEQLDAGKASGPGNAFSAPNFNDVSVNTKPADLGLDKPTVVTIDTFDNFSYTIKAGQKTNENYAITVAVAAQLPKERTPGKEEKVEDKDKLDKEFKENQKKLEEKLAQEKRYEKWTYLVSTWTVDPLLKPRHELLAEKKEEKKDEKKSDTTSNETKPPANEEPKDSTSFTGLPVTIPPAGTNGNSSAEAPKPALLETNSAAPGTRNPPVGDIKAEPR
jgi:hypothetical protein